MFYGIITTAVIMTFLYIILKTLNIGIVRSIPFYVTGVILSILLTIQLSLMIGAVKSRGMVDSIKITITQMMEGKFGVFNANESQRLLDEIIDNYPLVGVYVGNCDFSGNDTTTIAEAMGEQLYDFLTSYIWGRVGWSFVFIVVACAIAICFRKRESLYIIDPNTDLGIY